MADSGDDPEGQRISSTADASEDISSTSTVTSAGSAGRSTATGSSVPDSSTDAVVADSSSGSTSTPRVPTSDSSTDADFTPDSSSCARATTSATPASSSAPRQGSAPRRGDAVPLAEQSSPIDLSDDSVEISTPEGSSPEQDLIDLSSDASGSSGPSHASLTPEDSSEQPTQGGTSSDLQGSSGIEEQTDSGKSIEGSGAAQMLPTTERGGPSVSAFSPSTEERTVAKASPKKQLETPQTEEGSSSVRNIPPAKQDGSRSPSSVRSKSREHQEIDKSLSAQGITPVKRSLSPETAESSHFADSPGSATKKLATESRAPPDIAAVKRNLSLKSLIPSPSATKQKGSANVGIGEEVTSPEDSSSSSGFSTTGLSSLSGERSGVSVPTSAESSMKQGGSTDSPLSTSEEIVSPGDSSESSGFSEFKEEAATGQSRAQTLETSSQGVLSSATSLDLLSIAGPSTSSGVTAKELGISSVSGDVAGSPAYQGPSSVTGEKVEKEGVVRAEPDSTRAEQVASRSPGPSALEDKPGSSTRESELARQNPRLMSLLKQQGSLTGPASRNLAIPSLQPPGVPGTSRERQSLNSPLLRGLLSQASPPERSVQHGASSRSGLAEASTSRGLVQASEDEAEARRHYLLQRQFSFEEKLYEVQQESNHPEEAGEAEVPDVDNSNYSFLHGDQYGGTADSPPYTNSSDSTLDSAMESPATDFEQLLQDDEASRDSETQGTLASATSVAPEMQQQAQLFLRNVPPPPPGPPPATARPSITASPGQQAASSPVKPLLIVAPGSTQESLLKYPPPPPGPPPSTARRSPAGSPERQVPRSPVKPLSVVASGSTQESLLKYPPPPPGPPPSTARRSPAGSPERQVHRSPVKPLSMVASGSTQESLLKYPPPPPGPPPSTARQSPTASPERQVPRSPVKPLLVLASGSKQESLLKYPPPPPGPPPSAARGSPTASPERSVKPLPVIASGGTQQPSLKPPPPPPGPPPATARGSPSVSPERPAYKSPVKMPPVTVSSPQQQSTEPLNIVTQPPESPQRQANAAAGYKTPEKGCFSPEPGYVDSLLSPFGKLGTSPGLSPRSVPAKRPLEPEEVSSTYPEGVPCSPKKIPAAQSSDSRAATPVRGISYPGDRPSSSSPSADLCNPFAKLSTESPSPKKSGKSPEKKDSPEKEDED